jgi:hypothetical protein
MVCLLIFNDIVFTEPLIEDVTALEFEVKGVCEAISVILQPYAITIPGKTMVETLLKRQFKVLTECKRHIWQLVTI